MCSIHHELKAIYIQIPKTGGSYIHNVLRDCYNFQTYRYTRKDHKEYVGEDAVKDDERGCSKIYGFVNTRKTGILHYFKTSSELYQLSGITEEQWNTYTKFTFIRNPYDKFISAWKFIDKVKPINQSLLEFLQSKEQCDNSVYSHSFIPQSVHLMDERGEIHMDYFGRFENLNEDLIYILRKLGVPKITHHNLLLENIKFNQSSKKNYALHYTNETLEQINKCFDIDFSILNFAKCHTMNELLEQSKQYFCDEEQFNRKNAALIEQLKEDNFLHASQNVVLESKIRSIKNKGTNAIALHKLLTITKKQISTDNQFHAKHFHTLLEKFAFNMKQKEQQTSLTKK